MSPHDPLVTLIKTTEGKAKGEREKLLTRQLLEKAPPEDLAGYSAADLHELVSGRLAFLNERKPGRSKVAVTNPEAPFGAATVILCHPQMVAQCLAKTNRASPDELIDYAIRALK